MVRITDLDDESVEDEYDRDEMERLEREMPDNVYWTEPPANDFCYMRDNPAFSDISDMLRYQPEPVFNGPSFQIDYDSLYVGRIFNSKDDAKMACRKWSIDNGVEYRTERSGTKILHLVCKKSPEINCPWEVRILQRAKSSYWCIKEAVGGHTCNQTTILYDNFHLNRQVIAKHFEGILKATLRLDPRKIQEDVEKDFGLKISYLKAWQGKQTAMDNAFGTWDESFNQLPHLLEVIQSTNPDTFVKWDTTIMEDGSKVINRVFWSFGAAKQAFEHCKPVLSVDGTHLYGKYKGRILTAIAQDGETQILPLAFALVESENNSSWKWFMSCIREGVTSREGLCVISDRHKGLLAAMNTLEGWLPPYGFHRFCIRHICSNFNTKVKNVELKDELLRIGYIPDRNQFDRRFSEFCSVLVGEHQSMREWLLEIPIQKWSLAYDEGRRWGSMTSNNAECYNKVLKGSRDLPIAALVKFTFMQTNSWFVTRRELHSDHPYPFPPKVVEVIQEHRERCRVYKTQLFDREQMIVQVQDGGVHNVYQVCMADHTCSCGWFQAYHCPCSHAMAVIRDFRFDIQSYVHYCYTMAAYHNTWAPLLHQIPAEREWRRYRGPFHYPNEQYRRTEVGRYPSTRIHNEMDWSRSQSSQRRDTHGGEASGSAPSGQSSSFAVHDEASGSAPPRRVQRCKNCGGSGHNSRRCPMPPTQN